MATKIYNSHFPEYGIYVKVDGKETPVSFTGGRTLSNKGGSFRTDDEKVQEALEKHPMYNVRFKLTGTVNAKKQDDEKTLDKPVQNTSGNGSATVVEDVNNYQSAKSWLMKNKGVTSNDLSNADEVRAKAAELNVDFVNWKVKE